MPLARVQLSVVSYDTEKSSTLFSDSDLLKRCLLLSGMVKDERDSRHSKAVRLIYVTLSGMVKRPEKAIGYLSKKVMSLLNKTPLILAYFGLFLETLIDA